MNLHHFIYRFLPKSHRLRHLCELYAGAVAGEGSCDMEINGEKALLECLLPGCRRVLDVGANVGNFAGLALRINPQLQLVCFEPDPEAFKILSGRFSSSQVKVENLALGNQNGEVPFVSFVDSWELGSFYERPGIAESYQQKTIRVAVKTLDEYCKQAGWDSIDYVKIDVEGGEMDVLRGMESLLQKKRARYVHVEYSIGYIGGRFLFKDVFSLAGAADYRVFHIKPGGLDWVQSYQQKYENFRTKYFLLAREDSAAMQLTHGWKI